MDNREKELDAFFRKNDSSQKHRFAKDTKKDESAKIDEYFETVASEKKPVKKSWSDKIVDFFRIASFRHKFDEKKVSINQKQIEVETKNHPNSLNLKLKNFFISRFSFEAGVDILDETSVLYRKNLVIQSILFVTSIVFSLFMLIGSDLNNIKGNIILAVCVWLVMFFVSASVKKIIREEPKTLQKQQMGEILSSVYILMMALAVYIKLRVMLGYGTDTIQEGFFSITQAGYSLIYFALVVLALYQDSKLLSAIFKVTMVAMTLLHLTILYPVYLYASDFVTLWNYIQGPILIDLVLRTLVLAIFMIALYSTARITEEMNNKRKTELIKRRGMEKDFKAVVSDVFDVIGVYKRRGIEDEEKAAASAAKRIAELSSRLGNYLGYSPKLCKEIFDFSTIHIDRKDTLTLSDYDGKEVLDEDDFRRIREKTMIGSVIIKRLQLDQKGEDIVRAHFEKTADQDFIKEMNGIQNNRESQVILLSEIYEILRQDRNYKRALKHSRAIDLLQLEFYPYFDPQILDRFVKYTDDFESLYYKLAPQ
jgi:HD-GYP domain-containing protein (c-di-GMP phosphodiesterase class II)